MCDILATPSLATLSEQRTATLPIRMSNKWAPNILVCLQDGPRRFSELRAVLAGVTPKVLSESLRAMERDGMISRTAYAGMPPRVEYEMTELGGTLLEPLRMWCNWAQAHLPELMNAREAYARRACPSGSRSP